MVQKLHSLLKLITNAESRRWSEKMKEEKRDQEETKKKLRIVGGKRRLSPLRLFWFRFVSSTGSSWH